MRPSLIGLQNFANSYFENSPPAVKWGYLKRGVRGEANLNEKTIYLDSAHIYYTSSRRFIIEWGLNEKSCRGLKISNEEHYFLTLLHEIAKFKIKSELAREAKERFKTKEELLKKVEKDLHYEKLDRKKLDKEPMSESEEKEFLQERKEYYLTKEVSLNRQEAETDKEYQQRLEDFRNWFRGGFIEDHQRKFISITDWAINEFKKKRKEIRAILKNK